MVGAVVAREETVLGVGHHERAGLAHAEVVAMENAGASARGADLYVTLEPCNHHGRTPPCTDAIIQAGIARVFVGTFDSNPLVDGRGVDKLRAAGIEVVTSILEENCRDANLAFLHYIQNKRPYVIAKIAQSLDGRVATRLGESKWITGEAARAQGHVLRNATHAIAVGIGTVLLDDPALTTRIPNGHDAFRIVIDTHARTPLTAQVVKLVGSSEAPTWILVGETAPKDRVEALRKAGCEVIPCPVRDDVIDLEAAATLLGAREIVCLLLEGGPRLMGGFFDHKLVHEVHAFIAPLLIGGDKARSSVGGLGIGPLRDATHLDKLEITPLGSDIWVRGRVRTNEKSS